MMNFNATIALRNAPGNTGQQKNTGSIDSSASLVTNHLSAEERLKLDKYIDTACSRIAPLWPLKHFVAVNPFFGLSDMSFQDASDTLARILGHGIFMSRDYYREQIASGRIRNADLADAIKCCGSDISVDDVHQSLANKAPQPKMGMAPVSRILELVEGGIWSSFVTERISLHCAAYFDLGQATISMPWRDESLYAAWRKAAMIDMGPAMMGLGDFRHAVSQLPEDPRDAIAWGVDQLAIPEEAIERYLHASLLSIGGWAAWSRYLRWQAELTGKKDDAIVDLLAIRIMWDILLYQEKRSPALVGKWREMLDASMRQPSAKRRAAAAVDRVLLRAMEIGFQRDVINAFKDNANNEKPKNKEARPAVQAAFCIDVRSEVFRRALETVAGKIQTLGFAGFFGVFLEYVPFGADSGRSHVPVLFSPTHPVYETLKGDEESKEKARLKRRQGIGMAKMWKGFKYSATSAFSFVESIGLVYAFKLLTDSFGWTRPVPNPLTQGLDAKTASRLAPSIEAVSKEQCCSHHDHSGIPDEQWLDDAERILKAMGLTKNFARLVLLTGHGSNTVNNPHATALDCGACAGQTGEASARVLAMMLNKPEVRQGLVDRGIQIPDDCWFIAGLHDTTTDNVTLFDTEYLPDELADDLAQLQQWLEQASNLARMQRAGMLGLERQPEVAINAKIQQRSKDWSQVRPEWALANNAAFIAAPRQRTRGAELEGRAFLHDYKWQEDKDFKILELIMSAPMVVANWINMQYYGSVVDNETFGSGNKVLHNIVGGAIGVLEGNAGDLRVGLPIQSLHNGKKWMHEPLRLSVFIEAPEDAMDDIISRHETVRQLVENRWLHIFRICEDGSVRKRHMTGQWLAEEHAA